MKAMIEQHRNSLFENSCAIVTRSLSSRGVWELTCHSQFFKIQLKIPGGVHNHTRPLLNWAGRRGRRAQTRMCNAVCSTLASPLFAPGVRRRAARNSVSLLLLLGCLASATEPSRYWKCSVHLNAVVSTTPLSQHKRSRRGHRGRDCASKLVLTVQLKVRAVRD